MTEFPWLTTITFLPLFGALLIFVLTNYTGSEEEREQNASNAKAVALFVSLATFALSLLLFVNFDNSTAAFQFEEYHEWIEGYGIGYHMGIDGISLFFILLTALLMPICILVSWDSVKLQVREYMIAFLLLESLVIGVFASLDFLMFFFFFEASLIPMYLIIGIWGGENRIYAAFKFFLYTLLGSVFLLLAMLYIYNVTGTTDIPKLMELVPEFSVDVQKYLWLAFFASFAVKIPMWPMHTWLPDAHVQAPTAGSVILAGILLKLGGYGFLRFSLPMLPDASLFFADLVYGLSVAAVIITSLVALMQEDMKKLIAYSSVAHMGFVTIGIFTFNQQGIEGSIFQMISHGLVSGALFMCVGVLYDRVHTKEIKRYGGVVERMPVFALIFLFFTMASIGLPATSGFVGEFLVLTGAFLDNKLVALLASTGVVLGAAYMLWLYKRVVFGELNSNLKEILDVNKREFWAFIPLVLLTILLGIYPNIILDSIHVSVENLMNQIGNR